MSTGFLLGRGGGDQRKATGAWMRTKNKRLSIGMHFSPFAAKATIACAVPVNSGGPFSTANTPYRLIAVYNENPMPNTKAEINH